MALDQSSKRVAAAVLEELLDRIDLNDSNQLQRFPVGVIARNLIKLKIPDGSSSAVQLRDLARYVRAACKVVQQAGALAFDASNRELELEWLASISWNFGVEASKLELLDLVELFMQNSSQAAEFRKPSASALEMRLIALTLASLAPFEHADRNSDAQITPQKAERLAQQIASARSLLSEYLGIQNNERQLSDADLNFVIASHDIIALKAAYLAGSTALHAQINEMESRCTNSMAASTLQRFAYWLLHNANPRNSSRKMPRFLSHSLLPVAIVSLRKAAILFRNERASIALAESFRILVEHSTRAQQLALFEELNIFPLIIEHVYPTLGKNNSALIAKFSRSGMVARDVLQQWCRLFRVGRVQGGRAMDCNCS